MFPNKLTLTGDAQETSEYDKVGNLVATVNATAMQTGYQYDGLNRPLSQGYAGAGGDILFAYDQGPNAVGRLSRFAVVS
ncbi:MAG: RHS repeat protein [Desulfobulbaceae bacterium]